MEDDAGDQCEGSRKCHCFGRQRLVSENNGRNGPVSVDEALPGLRTQGHFVEEDKGTDHDQADRHKWRCIRRIVITKWNHAMYFTGLPICFQDLFWRICRLLAGLGPIEGEVLKKR